MDLIKHNSSYSNPFNPSYAQWEGSKPQRFKGGRKHDNHPMDELDNLLIGSNMAQLKPLGPSKKRY
jgi:hypothetical protein